MTDTSYEECRLEGGPSSMTEELRNVQVPADALTVKVRVHDGWEHFERIGEFTGTGTPVFHWTMCTKTAE